MAACGASRSCRTTKRSGAKREAQIRRTSFLSCSMTMMGCRSWAAHAMRAPQGLRVRQPSILAMTWACEDDGLVEDEPMRDRMNVYFPPELLRQIVELADRRKLSR